MPTTNRITLSPEAAATLNLPMTSHSCCLLNAEGEVIADCYDAGVSTAISLEIAAFIAALLNAALTPEPTP